MREGEGHGSSGETAERRLEHRMTPELGAEPYRELTVTPLSETEWRVDDSARPRIDGLPPLIGFVEYVNGKFEVRRVGLPSARLRFNSLNAGTDFLRRPQEAE
jgi:hypothetical protein